VTEHCNKPMGSITGREINYPPTGPSDFEDFYCTDWWEYVGEGIALFTWKGTDVPPYLVRELHAPKWTWKDVRCSYCVLL